MNSKNILIVIGILSLLVLVGCNNNFSHDNSNVSTMYEMNVSIKETTETKAKWNATKPTYCPDLDRLNYTTLQISREVFEKLDCNRQGHIVEGACHPCPPDGLNPPVCASYLMPWCPEFDEVLKPYRHYFDNLYIKENITTINDYTIKHNQTLLVNATDSESEVIILPYTINIDDFRSHIIDCEPEMKMVGDKYFGYNICYRCKDLNRSILEGDIEIGGWVCSK